MILPIYNSMARIKNDVIEAAKDLGASDAIILFKIIIPLTLSGIIGIHLKVLLLGSFLLLLLLRDHRACNNLIAQLDKLLRHFEVVRELLHLLYGQRADAVIRQAYYQECSGNNVVDVTVLITHSAVQAVSYTHLLSLRKIRTPYFWGRVHIGKESALKEKAFPMSSFSGFRSLSPIQLSSISVPLLRML